MNKINFPITPAIRFLKRHGLEFEQYLYQFTENGGTKQTASALNVDEYSVVKTLVLQGDNQVFIMLMHGNKQVSLKELARTLKFKSVQTCEPQKAFNHTGYIFGGTSPFGTRKALMMCAEKSIFNLDKIYINGGKQGFIVSLNPNLLKSIYKITEVSVAI